MNKKEALSTALSALHVLAAQECSDKLTPTLKKKCKERRNRYRKALEVLKELKNEL